MKIKKVRKVVLQTLSLQKQLVSIKPSLFLQQRFSNFKSQQIKRKSLAQLVLDQKKRKEQTINCNSPAKSQNQQLNIKLIRQRIQKFLSDQQVTKAVHNQKDSLSSIDILGNHTRYFLTQKPSSLKIKQKYLKKQPHSLQMLKRKLNMNQSRLRQQINNSLMRRSLKIGDSKHPRKGGYPYHMIFNISSSPLNKQDILRKQSKYQSQQNSDSQSMQKSFLIKRRKKQNKYLKRKQIIKINQIKQQSEFIMVNKKTSEQAKVKYMHKSFFAKKNKQQIFEPWGKHHDQQFFQQNLPLE